MRRFRFLETLGLTFPDFSKNRPAFSQPRSAMDADNHKLNEVYELKWTQSQRQFEGYFDLNRMVRVLRDNWNDRPRLFQEIHNWAEKFQDFTLDSMQFLFDYSQNQRDALRRILDKALEGPGSYATELQDLVAAELDNDEKAKSRILKKYDIARDYHVAYVAGSIRRSVPELEGKIPADDQGFEQCVATALKKEKEANKIAIISNYVKNTAGEQAAENTVQYLSENGWLLNDLSKSPVDVVANLAGHYATEATVKFAGQILKIEDESRLLEHLEKLFSQDEDELYRLAREPKDEAEALDAQIILFGVQSANLTWIRSKPYQTVVEIHQKKTGKKEGIGRINKVVNKYFLSFGAMSQLKGWPAVLLDKDQILTGIRQRLARLRA